MTYKIRKIAASRTRPTDYYSQQGWFSGESKYSPDSLNPNLLEKYLAAGYTALFNIFPVLTQLQTNYPLIKNPQNSQDMFDKISKISKNISGYRGLVNKCSKSIMNDNQRSEILKFLDFVEQETSANGNFSSQNKMDLFFKKSEKENDSRKGIANYIALVEYYQQECKKSDRKTEKKSSLYKKINDSINKYSQSMLHTNKTGYHNEFYRDALSGLGNSDPLLKNFYKGLQQEYHKDLKTQPQKRADLMDFFYEEEHIMSKAHPDSIVIADARHGGELLENNLEKHKKLVDIAQRRPLGNFR